MNCRQCELLIQFLYAPGRFFAYSDLAAGAGVSVRTIRNYISSINDYLRTAGFPPLTTRSDSSAGFCAGWDEGLRVRNLLLTSDFYLFRLSPAERRAVIVLTLLSSDEYLTLFALSRLLYVSKGTLLKDLEETEAYFLLNGVSLSPARNRGYKLVIPESLRRSLLYQHVLPLMADSFQTMKPAGILYQFVAERLLLTNKEMVLQSAAADIEARFGLQMDDAAFSHFVLHLNIWAFRVCAGHFVTTDEVAQDVAQSSAPGLMANRLADTLEAAFFVNIPDPERRYLGSLLIELSHLEGSQDGDMSPEIAVKSFLIAVSESLSLPLAADAELHLMLCAQIRKLQQLSGKLPAADPGMEEYIRQYPHIYRQFVSRLPLLDKSLVRPVGKVGASHLFVHIIAAVERYYHKQGAPKIIVVCDSGNGTAMYLTEKLRRRLNVNVIKTAPVRRIAAILQDHACDLLVSTVPLDVEVPWLQVSTALNSQDMVRLHDALDKCVFSRRANAIPAGVSSDSPLRFLHRNMVAVDCEAADWEEAIAIAGNLLVGAGCASPAYVQAMIDCVHRNGPYNVFVKGAALAHAACEAGFSGFALSLIRLKHPVPFGHSENDPVRYIAAVHTPGGRRFSKALFAIMDILCDTGLRPRLDAAVDSEAFYSSIVAHVGMSSTKSKECRQHK